MLFVPQRQQIQDAAVNEVKTAIKPFYQRKEITKDEYKEIVRKAVEKVSTSPSPRRRLPAGSRGSSWRARLRGPRLNYQPSESAGLPQQERRGQLQQGGQPGEGLRGQIQARPQEMSRRRRHRRRSSAICSVLERGLLDGSRFLLIFLPFTEPRCFFL